MKAKRNKNLIINYIFILGILILFINDQFLKFYYSNFITGKLSDICGIIIFPLFLTYIFPKLKENSIYITFLIFSFWKSEYSQSFINLYNEFSPIQTSRIIDYSDLFVLILLPIPFYFIKNIEKFQNIIIRKLNPKLVFTPSILIFISESPPPSYYYTMNKGNLQCYKCNIVVDYNIDCVLKKLRKNGIEFDSIKPIPYRGIIDSTSLTKQYIKKELIIENDTLSNINMTIIPLKNNKSEIYFNGMDVSQNLRTDVKLKQKLIKYYKKLIFKEIKKSLKESSTNEESPKTLQNE